MKTVLVILLVVGFLAAGIFLTLPVTQGQKEQQEKDEPTVVQKGQTTEEERAYSKAYNELYPDRSKNKLSERRKEIPNLGVMIGVVGDFVDIGEPPTTVAEFLNDLTCKSDTIAVGYIKNKIAHLSEDETYVYTKSDFIVEDVLKNNSGSSIEVGHIVDITRPGGVIKLDDRIITVADEKFQPLQLKKKYLLFLRFVPSTNGFMIASSDGDFVLENNSFQKISKTPSPVELKNGKSPDLLKNVRQSVSDGCKESSKGGN